MADEPLFQTLDGSKLQNDLMKLLFRTARDKGRVEITCDGGNCVVISKEELDSLEGALEILSRTHDAQALHQAVQHFADLAEHGEAASA